MGKDEGAVMPNEGELKPRLRRVRFWAGMLLLIVLGLGLLVLHCWRKAQGPPPTMPGKCPAFDKHLEEIDRKWQFVFLDDKELVLTDIHGKQREVVLDVQEEIHENKDVDCLYAGVSPDNVRIWLTFADYDEATGDFSDPRILLLDLKANSTTIITPDANAHIAFMMLYWLSPSVFLVSVGPRRIGGLSGFPAEPSLLCLRYDLDETDNPAEVELHIRPLDLFSRERFFFDRDAATALFLAGDPATASSGTGPYGGGPIEDYVPEPSGDQDERLRAYDVNGLRDPTDAEKASFQEASEESSRWERPPTRHAPAVKVEEVSGASWLTNLMQRLGRRSFSKQRILLDGEVVRLTRGMGRVWMRSVVPEWDDHLSVLMWYELLEGKDCEWYIMDKEGHYRFWRSGIYVGKIPRDSREDKQDIEE